MNERENPSPTGTDVPVQEANKRIYRGLGEPHDGIDRLPSPPPWRSFEGRPVVKVNLGYDPASGRRLGALQRGQAYHVAEDTIDQVNAALLIRRPLLITGRPGTGKSTLAYSIAFELRLGPVLYWPVTGRSTIEDGLYRYDAIGRLQEANLAQYQRTPPAASRPTEFPDVGRYIRLGPLGTALLPQARPRVLLIDELDKSDIDLPNDLLNVFEEGSFEIPELARLPETQPITEVMIEGGSDRVRVERGKVRCFAFPIIVMTSNGERPFPPAFLRRCVQADIKPPTPERLLKIITSMFDEAMLERGRPVIERFLNQRETRYLAVDQLLNALFLINAQPNQDSANLDRMIDAVLRSLDGRGS